ncbi:hypothetical protein OG204_20785 [Streptomyces sp. NBC_01387]|uniref:hypothetical protein n=1 Tax=unclassified Streptomyces TaxID=2593676 RepID=UPI0020245A6E|nr:MULTISPECIES: hypothetical protein [unclassified Streptomyces]MCX4549229.1 hypothetical protein [Streptomyces sp. NBC_01500]WSC20796.1 hypothetical protein OIE60_14475 [Streptomyces sp. NBC_01766]WSV54822.1 hypothetical protein OG282_14520 [Streptomyces sp. NBC_01014]
MGWTHDYGDAASNRRSATGLSTYERDGTPDREHDPRLGIPRILRRRARWVSARLRHSRP